jgi:hypothetical protein
MVGPDEAAGPGDDVGGRVVGEAVVDRLGWPNRPAAGAAAVTRGLDVGAVVVGAAVVDGDAVDEVVSSVAAADVVVVAAATALRLWLRPEQAAAAKARTRRTAVQARREENISLRFSAFRTPDVQNTAP